MVNSMETDFDIDILWPESSREEWSAEENVRPSRFDDFIAQETVKRQLQIIIDSATQREAQIDHILLSGPPGLGKTTLAYIIADHALGELHQISGPGIETPRDILSILTSLKHGDVLFVDEIHRMPRIVEEILYPAMEDFHVEIKRPNANPIILPIKPFTLLGATTQSGMLSEPLRTRFGHFTQIDYYSSEDLAKIAQRTTQAVSQLSLDKDAAIVLGERSRGTPRVVNRLVRRLRDFMLVEHGQSTGIVGSEQVSEALELFGVDQNGFDPIDRQILALLCGPFKDRPTGLKTLAASTGLAVETIIDVHEPFLLRSGFLIRTPSGRLATEKAHEWFSQVAV